VHIFSTLTGKLTRTYDESLTAISEMQQAGTAVYQLDDMDFARRLAVERELDRDEAGPGGALGSAKAVWDESGNFVLYPTMLGIKGELSPISPHTEADVLRSGLMGSGQYRDEQGV
jgi:peptidylprolyl isomerase domain and WD repeat-containing protein 1